MHVQLSFVCQRTPCPELKTEPLLKFDLWVQAEELAHIKFPLSPLPPTDQSYALFIMGDHVTLLSHAHSGIRNDNNNTTVPLLLLLLLQHLDAGVVSNLGGVLVPFVTSQRATFL